MSLALRKKSLNSKTQEEEKGVQLLIVERREDIARI